MAPLVEVTCSPSGLAWVACLPNTCSLHALSRRLRDGSILVIKASLWAGIHPLDGWKEAGAIALAQACSQAGLITAEWSDPLQMLGGQICCACRPPCSKRIFWPRVKYLGDGSCFHSIPGGRAGRMGVQVAHLPGLEACSLQGPGHGQLSPHASRIRLHQMVCISSHATGPHLHAVHAELYAVRMLRQQQRCWPDLMMHTLSISSCHAAGLHLQAARAEAAAAVHARPGLMMQAVRAGAAAAVLASPDAAYCGHLCGSLRCQGTKG